MENIAEKIRKLLRLAEKTTFAAEAASAIGKAQALMLEHKITQMALDEKPPTEEIKDFQSPLDDPGKKQLASWRWRVADILCGANGCYAFVRGSQIYMVGKPSNAENVRYLFAYCIEAIDRITKERCAGEGRTYSNNFRIGCAEGIGEAISEERDQMRRRYQAITNDIEKERSLILVDRAVAQIYTDKAEAKAFATKKFSLRQSGGSGYRGNSDARGEGRAAGRSLYPGQNRRLN